MNAIGMETVEFQILREMIAPDRPTMTASEARNVLKLSFTSKQKKEMEHLLDLNGEDELSDQQREKLEAYVRIGNMVSLLRAKAQNSLAQSGVK